MTSPAAAPDDDPPGRWRALAVLASALLLAMTTWFSASAVLPQLRAEWDLSRTTGSWLTIAVQLGFVVGAVASAALNLPDLVRPRTLMLLGALPPRPRTSDSSWRTDPGWRCRSAR